MPSIGHHSRTPLRRAILVGITLALAGTAYAGGSFDGTYKGTKTTIESDNGTLCSALTGDPLIVVRNNHFTRPWAQAELSVDIAGNGTFSQGASYFFDISPRQAVITIRGKITGGDLEANLGSQTCVVHLSLKKS